MHTNEILDRLLAIINETTTLYRELYNDLPPLQLLPNDEGTIPFPTVRPAPAGEVKLKPTTKEVNTDKRENTKYGYAAFLKLYKKEIRTLQQTLLTKIEKALSAPTRYHKGVWEKRAQINGISIYGSALTKKECENKFFYDFTEKFAAITGQTEKPQKKQNGNMAFCEWADIWYENIFKESVNAYTFEREYKTYQRHILPFFGKKKIKDITPLDCTQYFNLMKQKGIGRTAETCYGHLSRIFRFAVDNALIAKSPMANMKPVKHERENGIPLSKEEEAQLLRNIRGTEYEALIVLALYTGLRPCEIDTARLEGNFIVARNRKQKNEKKIVYKKIPITPMLERYRALLESDLPKLTREFSRYTYANTFKKAMPQHRLYDLRDTFATRCQECGVIEQAVQCFMGHVPNTLLGKVYTKFSDEFLYDEGKKVNY